MNLGSVSNISTFSSFANFLLLRTPFSIPQIHISFIILVLVVYLLCCCCITIINAMWQGLSLCTAGGKFPLSAVTINHTHSQTNFLSAANLIGWSEVPDQPWRSSPQDDPNSRQRRISNTKTYIYQTNHVLVFEKRGRSHHCIHLVV